MYVTKKFLLEQLPPFRNERVTVVNSQDVEDIIKTMLQAHKEFAPFYDKIGQYFLGSTVAATCDNIARFCHQNLKYVEESERVQTVSVPQGLLTAGRCDCKGYASFAAGCLAAIERKTGRKINWEYCFASYKLEQETPYHVFVIVQDEGGEIWIDPTPGADNMSPVWWIRKNVKNTSAMLQKVIGRVNEKSRVGTTDEGDTYQGPKPETMEGQGNLASTVLRNALLTPTAVQSDTPQVSNNIPPITLPKLHTTVFNNVNVPVTDSPESNNATITTILLAAAAIGGYMLLTKKGKSVGGKGKGKKNSMFPLLLIGGGAAALWYFSQPAAQPMNTLPVPTSGGTLPNPNDGPTYQAPPPVEAQAIRAGAAVQNQEALERYYPQLTSTYKQMTDAEINAMYNYIVGYVANGKKLYSGPGATGVYTDGGWDTVLYFQIDAIRKKYNISI